jgi:putative ABC transport system ATP-binding protein
MELSKTAVSLYMLSKVYTVGDVTIEVLNDLSLKVQKGQFAVITGASGSGKTTLLNIVAAIDKPTDGSVVVFDENLNGKDEDFLADFRCSNIGFVFQSYNLVSTLTVAENVAFPMEWSRKPQAQIAKQVTELLRLVGLERRGDHFPFQLSGGEQQRVAFARALANDPQLLLVDEPTGNLDTKTSQVIVGILRKLQDDGKTAIIMTHDEQVLDLAKQRLRLESGKLVEQNG